ncbi:cell division protein FtsZ [Empedobacter brevis]|uniref:Cell division protein FtsZ n=1 Tax=Empedobacter brevis TaxID=247 RepID=A0AAJ1QGI6_9FLAO|nr:cell division protein FtsZ [Empedobacter brevis]MDM1073584.1 cell division protein FtsZ [Empedobacter brevis]QES94364.1 cell division protein FtsZ [Empedobacter brevis]
MLTGDIVFNLPKSRSQAIKVIGVGGGGSNAVNYMFEQGIAGVEFVICNTDSQALANSPVPTRIQLGQAITEGLGAGANPEVGEQSAIESMDDVKAVLDEGTKMVFITAGMGGGTGTGAAPVIAGIAKEMDILTVGIVTAPFFFEGRMRLEQAEKGIEKLRQNVDSLIVINNDKLRELYGNLGFKNGFSKADEVLTTAAKGIAEVITQHYAMNIDLRDARTVLKNSGTAIMGSAQGSGENKAKDAISSALDSPLLNNNKITGARNVLLLILSGNNEITMDEIGIINDYIQQEAGNSANIIMGIGEDLDLGDSISVTVVATGFPTEDQAYTGKEEQKIVHTLEEEQPINKTLSVDQPFVNRVKPMTLDFGRSNASTQAPQTSQQNQMPEAPQNNYRDADINQSFQQQSYHNTPEQSFEENNAPKRYVLDDIEDEPVQEKRSYDDFEPRLKSDFNRPQERTNDVTNNNQSYHSYSNHVASEQSNYPQNNYTGYKAPKNEGYGNVEPVQSNVSHSTVPQPEQVQVAVDPFNQPIEESNDTELNNMIEERRNRLKQFNFKFNNTMTNSQVDEYEAIPAYKRQGLNLTDRQDNQSSDFSVGTNRNNETQIRPNNFLHDNVD